MPTVTKVTATGKVIAPAKSITVETTSRKDSSALNTPKAYTYTHKNKGKDNCIKTQKVYVKCEDMYCSVCGSPYVLI